MKNSVVERKGTVLKRSVVRQNTVTFIQSNPALTFAVVTIPTSEIPTHSTATAPSPRSTNPRAPLAGVSIRPHAVSFSSSPSLSFSTRSCLRFAFGVGTRRVLADCVATGGSQGTSLASMTSSAPVLSDLSRATVISFSSLPRMPWAPLARAPLAQATLGVL